MQYHFQPPPPQLPDARIAGQSFYVNIAKLFPDADFWDRACALFLDELVSEQRVRHGHVRAGALLAAIREAQAPEWLDARLFAVVALETYRRVFNFAQTCASAGDFRAA